MNRLTYTLASAAVCVGMIALPVGLMRASQAAATPVESPCTTDTECEAAGLFIVIGTGCGPDKVIAAAFEEDEIGFAHCDAIEPYWIQRQPMIGA